MTWSTPRYVQHVSGKGARWEVDDTSGLQPDSLWRVKAHADDSVYCYLPRSEYRLCEPPETWRDVTAECEWSVWSVQRGIAYYSGITHYKSVPSEVLRVMGLPDLYRLRKVQLLEADPHNETTGDIYPTCGHPRVHNVWAFIVEERQP